jgi:general secretion pathway protein G
MDTRVGKRNPRKCGFRTRPGAGRERPGGRGFTIIEICIVLAIIGILAAIAVPAYKNYVDRNLVKLCIRNIRLLENAIKIYEMEHMRLPNTLNELGPVEFLNQNGNSIRQSPPFLDPYGNAFQYLNFANEPPGWPDCRRDGVDKPLSLDYDLYSMGADGVTNKKLNHANSLDDIVRARSGAFVDLASKY